MLQSVSGLGMDYHFTHARQKKEGKMPQAPAVMAGVVYVSTTPLTLLHSCTFGLLITLHAVRLHMNSYPHTDRRESLIKHHTFSRNIIKL